MRKSIRTFGWFQDAAILSRGREYLEDIAELDIVTISSARGIAQDSIKAGRWADDSYIRFLHALGFIDYDRDDGGNIAITDTGWQLLSVEPMSQEEHDVFLNAVLSYPPACRMLQLLLEKSPRDKFDLAQHLGFVNEPGFKTYSRELFDEEIRHARTAKERSTIRSNKESTNEKYARMIANVLKQLDLINSGDRADSPGSNLADTPHIYRITPKGRSVYNHVIGRSIKRRIDKRVPFEMLASRAFRNSATILRERRALLLEQLCKSGTIELGQYFETIKTTHPTVYSEIEEIAQDIQGLINCGINITVTGTHYHLNDRLVLDFPIVEAISEDIDCTETVNMLIEKEVNIDPALIESTIISSLSGDKYLEFEDNIYNIFSEVMEFQGERLGGPNAPDSLIWYEGVTCDGSYGLIVDTKSRRGHFNLYINYADQMRRYIDDYSANLKSKDVGSVYFLWVSSRFSKGAQSNLTKFIEKRNVSGSCLSAYNSLLLAGKSLQHDRHDRLSMIESLFCSGKIIEENDIEIIMGS